MSSTTTMKVIQTSPLQIQFSGVQLSGVYDYSRVAKYGGDETKRCRVFLTDPNALLANFCQHIPMYKMLNDKRWGSIDGRMTYSFLIPNEKMANIITKGKVFDIVLKFIPKNYGGHRIALTSTLLSIKKSSHTESTQPKTTFQIGDECEMMYCGDWIPVTIVSTDTTTNTTYYNVQFNSRTDIIKTVTADFIRAPQTDTKPKFQLGQRVEYCINGVWYEAVVKKIKTVAGEVTYSIILPSRCIVPYVQTNQLRPLKTPKRFREGSLVRINEFGQSYEGRVKSVCISDDDMYTVTYFGAVSAEMATSLKHSKELEPLRFSVGDLVDGLWEEHSDMDEFRPAKVTAVTYDTDGQPCYYIDWIGIDNGVINPYVPESNIAPFLTYTTYDTNSEAVNKALEESGVVLPKHINEKQHYYLGDLVDVYYEGWEYPEGWYPGVIEEYCGDGMYTVNILGDLGSLMAQSDFIETIGTYTNPKTNTPLMNYDLMEEEYVTREQLEETGSCVPKYDVDELVEVRDAEGLWHIAIIDNIVKKSQSHYSSFRYEVCYMDDYGGKARVSEKRISPSDTNICLDTLPDHTKDALLKKGFLLDMTSEEGKDTPNYGEDEWSESLKPQTDEPESDYPYDSVSESDFKVEGTDGLTIKIYKPKKVVINTPKTSRRNPSRTARFSGTYVV